MNYFLTWIRNSFASLNIIFLKWVIKGYKTKECSNEIENYLKVWFFKIYFKIIKKKNSNKIKEYELKKLKDIFIIGYYLNYINEIKSDNKIWVSILGKNN